MSNRFFKNSVDPAIAMAKFNGGATAPATE